MSAGHGILHLHHRSGRAGTGRLPTTLLVAGSLVAGTAVLATSGLALSAIGTAVMAPAQHPDPQSGFVPKPPAQPAAAPAIRMHSLDGAIIMPHARRVPGR